MTSPWRMSMRGSRGIVSYPKADWTRSEAWDHLHAQMIPGCPKVRIVDPMYPEVEELVIWGHGWEKWHTENEWSWHYVGRRHG